MQVVAAILQAYPGAETTNSGGGYFGGRLDA